MPEQLSQTCTAELAHIDQWAKVNNLKLNLAKSFEIIFHSRHHSLTASRAPPSRAPPEIAGITRVKHLKCSGATLTHNFDFEGHISDVINSSSQSHYALRMLCANGMHNSQLFNVFKATALARLLYDSLAWWGVH